MTLVRARGIPAATGNHGGLDCCGILWLLPLAFAMWTAFHPADSRTVHADAPLTLENFETAWARGPFARYFLNTTLLVTFILVAQLIL